MGANNSCPTDEEIIIKIKDDDALKVLKADLDYKCQHSSGLGEVINSCATRDQIDMININNYYYFQNLVNSDCKTQRELAKLRIEARS